MASEHNVVKAECDDIKVERNALENFKHYDQEEIKRLTLLISKLKSMAIGSKSAKVSTQIDRLVPKYEEKQIA